MAEKKDIFIKDKIYAGVEEPLPSGTYGYNNAIPKWEEKVKGLTSYPVTGTHSFKDGQPVVKGVDYKLDADLKKVKGTQLAYNPELFAVAIHPPDELDKEAKLIEFIENELLICESEILNSKFLIMHDVKSVREYWRGKHDTYTTLKQKIKSL